MNVLLVINAKWWNAEAAYAYSLGCGLMTDGHKVAVVALTGNPVAERAKEDGIPVYETEALNSYNPIKIARWIADLVKIIEKENIEVINCHRSEGYPLVVAAAALSSPKPALVRTRGDQRRVKSGFLNRLLYEKLSDAVIASGEVVKRGIIDRLGLPETQVDVIYAPVDTEKFRQPDTYEDIRGELGIRPGEPLVAILGRVSEVKGHRYFIEAVPAVLEDFPSTKFLIIVKEDDENLPRLQRQVAEAGLREKVLFTGFREDLIDVMASCDIGVVTSIGSETNCRVVLEWMAMGKPVIGTTVGVIPEVIRDGETGFLVPPADPSATAEAVKKLLGAPGLITSFGMAGRKLAESDYSKPIFVKKTLEVYRKALRKKAGEQGEKRQRGG